ncbi:MAG: NUDIX domain-containing protein [Acidimicrobiales bacterium]
MEQSDLVVGAVIVEKGRAFVMRRSPGHPDFQGCGDIPGGHVKLGESLEEVLSRELVEQTGWTLAAIWSEWRVTWPNLAWRPPSIRSSAEWARAQ